LKRMCSTYLAAAPLLNYHVIPDEKNDLGQHK
jgi:hypothetical protein